MNRLFSLSRLPAVAAITIPCVAATAFYGAPGAGASGSKAGVSIRGTTRQIQGVSTAQSPTMSTTSGAQAPELFQAAGAGGDGAALADRSNSTGSGATAVGAVTQPKPVTTSAPGLLASFQGLNHFDNRFGNIGSPNTFSVEPPDQGLCVGSDGNGNTRVVEALNDVIGVYTPGGQRVTPPEDLNRFYGYPPAIIRMSNPADDPLGPFVTDPSCYYDASVGRWYVDVLTLDVFPRFGEDGLEHFTGTDHLDLAVSQTSDPTGAWTIYRIPVQDDGTDGTPNHHCSPGTDTAAPLPTNPTGCIGDYPHLGVDANGVYLTTNEYSLFGIEFHGAQVYALSKAELASGSPSVTLTQFDTHGMDSFGFAQNGFTLWPSTTPGGGGDASSGGTEWLLSSNAAAEAHDPGDGSSTSHPSTQLLTWALTNTSSLASGTPALSLSNTVLDVGRYAQPPSANQKSGNTPLRDCLNNNSCSTNFVLGIKDPFNEQPYNLDSNDTRMQQVTWVNGRLWGALDTALQVSSATQAGIEWFDVAPSSAAGSASATLANQGYLGVGNDNLTYPAIGVTSSGTGVMGFTLVGSDFYPSAGYATVTDAGVSAVHISGAGVGPADGFSGYKVFGNTPGIARPRWGDYGAAVPVGGNVWIASEYIAQSCSLATFEKTNFRCGNTRTQLANWSTRISEVAAP